MHIPDGMIQGTVCPVTAALSVAGVAGAAFCAARMEEKPDPGRFAGVTALIFAAQMMNFPVQNGTSGHLLGGVLASALLGLPHGVLSLAVVVTLQCLLFADGGLSVLGANLFNMALVGAGLGGWLCFLLGGNRRNVRGYGALATASWCSVMLAAFAVSVELAVDGAIAFTVVAPAMLGVHALIGLGEAILTVLAVAILPVSREHPVRGPLPVPLLAALVIGLVLSPWASGWPDGLEWVAEKYAFLHEAAPVFVAPLPDYAFPGVDHEGAATALAGLMGVLATFAFAWLTAWALHRLVKSTPLPN